MLGSVECESHVAFEREIEQLKDALASPETEESWDYIADAIAHSTTLFRTNASTYPHESVAALRSISRSINAAVNSKRSKLSGIAVEFLSVTATAMGPTFESIIPLFLPNLLALCTRSNKVFVSRARSCILAIVEQSRAASVLSYLAEAAKDKAVSLRTTAADAVLVCLNCFNPPDLAKEPRAREIEAVIKSTSVDASADVRKMGRKIFEAYTLLLPERVDKFTQPLSPTVKKYLDIKPTTKPDYSTSSQPSSRPPSRPASSQSTNAINGTARTSRAESRVTTKGRTKTMERVKVKTAQETFFTYCGPSKPSNRATTLQRSVSDTKNMPPPNQIPDRSTRQPKASGPQRPVTVKSEPKSKPSTSKGPLRAVVTHDLPRVGPRRIVGWRSTSNPTAAGVSGRVVGGARRVLLASATSAPGSTTDASSSEAHASKNGSGTSQLDGSRQVLEERCMND